jgi:hypothetical protein
VQRQTACSFRWFIVLKVLFAGLLGEKNTAEWLLIVLISPNEHDESMCSLNRATAALGVGSY